MAQQMVLKHREWEISEEEKVLFVRTLATQKIFTQKGYVPVLDWFQQQVDRINAVKGRWAKIVRVKDFAWVVGNSYELVNQAKK